MKDDDVGRSCDAKREAIPISGIAVNPAKRPKRTVSAGIACALLRSLLLLHPSPCGRAGTYQTGSRFFTGKNEPTGVTYEVPAIARMVSAVVPSALNAAKRTRDNAKTNAARPKLICLRMSASELLTRVQDRADRLKDVMAIT